MRVPRGSCVELLLLLKESNLTESTITTELKARGFITAGQSPRRVNTMWRNLKKAWFRWQVKNGDKSRQVLLPSMHARRIPLRTLKDRTTELHTYRLSQRARGATMLTRHAYAAAKETEGATWELVVQEAERAGKIIGGDTSISLPGNRVEA